MGKPKPVGKTTIVCTHTRQTVETTTNAEGMAHLPHGWKRMGDACVSAEAMQRCYAMRCLTVPVERAAVGYAEPDTIPEADAERTEDWTAFRFALSHSWRECAQAANLIVRELAVLDREPLVLGKKGLLTLPKFTPDAKPIYAMATRQYPNLDTRAASQILQVVKAKYMAERFDVRVRCSQVLPSFRDPMPLPCTAQSSPLLLDSKGRVCLRLSINHQRFTVRLKSDPKRFGRQTAPLVQAARGELVRGDVKIRQGSEGQVLVGVSIYLPRQIGERDCTEAFLVRTDPAALLVGEMWGRNAFVINADEVRRWQTAHGVYLQRMSQDRKAERRGRVGYTEEDSRRSRKQHARNTQRALETRCDKHERRMADALHKTACAVANHAQRRKVATVIYDDKERSYASSFPWARLKTLLKEKLDARGIALIAHEAEVK